MAERVFEEAPVYPPAAVMVAVDVLMGLGSVAEVVEVAREKRDAFADDGPPVPGEFTDAEEAE